MLSTRRLAPAALAPLLATTLVACGGDLSPGDEVDAKEFAERISDAADDSSSAQVEMELTSSGLVTTSEGEVDYTGDEPALTMSMSAPAIGDQKIRTTLVDGTMYLSVPGQADAASAWYRIDLDDPDNPLADLMGGMEALDPRATIESFGKGLEKVVYKGEESVEGVDTTHYEVTGDTSSVTSGAGAGKGAAAKLPETLTYDVWLDEEDRLIHMEADLDEQGSMSLTMTDWGEPVEIEAPPKEQVRDYPTGNAAQPKP